MKDKAIRLYQYLQRLIKLRMSVILDSDKYIDTLWLSEIPHHELCHCSAWEVSHDDDDLIWIEIKRPILPKVPLVPEQCSKWVDLRTLEDYRSEPVLKEKIISDDVPNDANDQNFEENYLYLSEHPEVVQVWETYLNNKWKVWSEEFARSKEVQDIYSRLFSMYQQQKALGESYEVVVCLGLLNYKTTSGADIYRHFISAQTELVFEANKGTIVIKASPDGAKLQFETEMIDPSEQPPTELQINLEKALKDISDDIWDKSIIHPIIRSWVNAFNPKAVYQESLIPVSKQDRKDYPIASFSPAVILRKRPNRGMLQFIDKLIEQLQANEEIPASIKIFLDIADINDNRGKADGEFGPADEKPTSTLPQEIYFPLPSNDEQFRIIKESSNKKGILVQGPPGTGKSHTIANLISHLLATGKKVLVTSQTARALKVLKSKIPEKIQPLCVSILGNRQEDFDNLRNAVHDITNRFYSWNEDSCLRKIKKIENDLYKLRQRKQEVKVAMRELREKETYKHSIIDGRYNGTALSIAKVLSKTESINGWVPDEIKSEEVSPLTDDEFARVVQLNRKFTDEKCKELGLKHIGCEDVFTPEEFVEMVEKEQKFQKKEEQLEEDIELRLLYNKLKNLDFNKRKKLLDSTVQLDKVKTEALRRPLSWLNDAVSAMLGDQDQPLKQLFSITKKYLEDLKGKAMLADECTVVLPNDRDKIKIKADAEDLLQHFSKGKNLGWLIFRPKIYKRVKYLTQDILIDGRNCADQASLEKLINFINVENTLQKLKEAWKGKIDNPTGANFNQNAIFEEQLEALEVVLAIEPTLLLAKEAVKELEIISEPCWHNDEEVKRLILALEATFVIDKLGEIEQAIEKLKISLQTLTTYPNAHPINQEFLDCLSERNWSEWAEVYSRLEELETCGNQMEEYKQLMRRLERKAPLLIESLCNKAYDEIWDKRSQAFNEAWDWLRADAWLKEFDETHNEYQLQREHIDLESELGKTVAKLASEKAWYNCFIAMTEEQRQHLMAWAKAIQRIGKGTGKRAEKHRRDAEVHMEQCREAIPGWIMPLYRVAESIAPYPEIFDVVIVDEASQCGPEALILMYIAKKCIIVGDDQQISPEGVGVNRQDVDLLINKYLSDVPHTDSYGLESSLFTHAEIRFGSRIVLREHFRCVPEIIQFSNDLCYSPLGVDLVPLRNYPPNRLEPIKVKHIREGFREGTGSKVINRPEAEALVAQIKQCCQDSRYKGKTMGVVSLQGDLQARYIEQLLVNTIGPEEIDKRNLVCGNPYDFQGDERDVIFISLVAATNQRIGPFVKETDKRRFNVAASRAKDQLWLFHSCTENDLSNRDYRYRLLTYCQHPQRVQHEIDEDLFESQFERDVYERIVSRGYKVIPQFRFAGYRIDLVVEGLASRLAIECDGDVWHGPEQYESDQVRQRILERAGWKFWRVRGSTFYRDPPAALESLWEVLEDLEVAQPRQKVVMQEKKIEGVETAYTLPERESIQYDEQEKVESDRLDEALNFAKKVELAREKESAYQNNVKKQSKCSLGAKSRLKRLRKQF